MFVASAISSTKSGLSEAVAKLETTVADILVTITGLLENVTALQTSVNDIHTDVVNLTTTVDTLDDTVTTLSNSVNAIQVYLGAYRTRGASASSRFFFGTNPTWYNSSQVYSVGWSVVQSDWVILGGDEYVSTFPTSTANYSVTANTSVPSVIQIYFDHASGADEITCTAPGKQLEIEIFIQTSTGGSGSGSCDFFAMKYIPDGVSLGTCIPMLYVYQSYNAPEAKGYMKTVINYNESLYLFATRAANAFIPRYISYQLTTLESL
jgi:uncharacterized coiled-coil protein SlyX